MDAKDRLTQAYDKEQKTISEQLRRLRQALTAHKARFKDNGQFNDVGELNEVSRELEGLIGFLKGQPN